jgi:peptidoglycan-N-acetylglucosamine deacetylase
MGDDIPCALSDGNASLLEFSVDWTLDDFRHYTHNRDLGHRVPISSPQRAMDVFRSEFDAAWEFGTLWISVWHPALAGRLARFKAVSNSSTTWAQRAGSGSRGSTRCAITCKG